MEKLAEALRPPFDGPKILRNAAISWASYSMHTYSGKLLRDSMQISLSICHFLNEYESEPKPKRDSERQIE